MKRFVCLGALSVFCCFAQAKQQPNIVYIVVDNVTFEHMGAAYGGENVTPAMDSIVERGVRFERMYVASSMCIPSRYSILSGRYPEQCTSENFLDRNPPRTQFYDHLVCELEPGRPNLATALRDAGYRTGFVGKFHNYEGELGPEIKLTEKTHISDPEMTRLMRERNDATAAHIASCGFDWVGAAEFGNGFGLLNHHGMKLLDTDGVHHNLEWEVEYALKYLDESAKGEKPFFLYMATKMFHLPFKPDIDLLGDYETIGRYTERGVIDKAPVVPMPSRREIYEMARDDGTRPMVSTGMRYLDFGVKAVLDRIESLGLKDNTIVVFLSDNNQDGKSTVYEGGVHVPSSMMWPKAIPAGQTCPRILSSLDIVATLMDAAGATEADGMDLNGDSFLPMVTGTPDQPWDDQLMVQYGFARGLVTPKWKYVAVRYPEEQWEKIRAEEARNPDAPDFGRNPVPARKWKKNVKPNLHAQQIPHAYNIYRYWHPGDQNHIMRVDNFPDLFALDQLYDLEADPAEQKSLAGNPEFAPVLKQMQDKLKTEVKKMNRPYGEFSQ